MKRLLKDLWEVFLMTVVMLIGQVILPFLICFLPAVGVSYIASFFTNNHTILFVIGLCVYVVVGAIYVLLVKRYEDKQKNSQKDTRE